MGVRRRTLIVGFAMALFLGVAVYFRLWSMDSMDSSFTADDREILRFDSIFCLSISLDGKKSIFIGFSVNS